MNDETFINKWWSGLSSPINAELEEWVAKSYSSKDQFWKEVVFSRQEQLLPPSESIYGRSYNFYHDCVLRYIHTNNIAFSRILENEYPENWTYEKVHTCVNYHVDKWTDHHPESGQLIAIIGSPNIHFCIALLTALRFGLKICYLPTTSPYLGKQQIFKFLSETKPRFIVSESPSFSIDGAQILPVNEKGVDEEEHAPHSHSYLANEGIQIALSLQQQEALTWVPLDAQTCYLYALRDALFTFNLFQHPYWAAPLSCAVRTEPCSTIMSLLCGVTRVIVSEEALRKNPRLLEDARINLLGFSNELLQLWNQGAGMPQRYLKCCYKSPLDVHFQTWKSFVQLHKLEKIPSLDVVLDNSLGGATLFSRPSLEPFNVYLRPTLGTAWHLSHYNGSGQESLTGYGIFEIDQADKGNFTATQIENQLMLTGIVEPAREGVTFPYDQLETIVSDLAFVEGCVLHHILKAGSVFSRFFVLLVFVNPLNKDPSKSEMNHWTEEINKKVTQELGTGYLPNKIEFFSLMPKRSLLGIDGNWCANQYDSGLLFQKNRFPHYRMIGGLRKLAQEYVKEGYGR